MVVHAFWTCVTARDNFAYKLAHSRCMSRNGKPVFKVRPRTTRIPWIRLRQCVCLSAVEKLSYFQARECRRAVVRTNFRSDNIVRKAHFERDNRGLCANANFCINVLTCRIKIRIYRATNNEMHASCYQRYFMALTRNAKTGRSLHSFPRAK